MTGSRSGPTGGHETWIERQIREATERGPVDTEQQRHAVTSYRALVEALLGQHGSGHPEQADPHSNGRHVPTREEHSR